MDFGLAPPNGVGPLRIGMTRQSADTALDALRDPSAVSESDRPGRHIFRPGGLMISIQCTQDLLEAVELGRPLSRTDRVLLRGLDVFAIPAREVVPCSTDERAVLELALHALPSRPARELRSMVEPLDALYMARTWPDPYASPDEGWWARRCWG